ncbi:NUDIX hydrolase [Deinococcus alpinitundrae]|uniref:NUDIX hydrolase n=1 Tax=Deinococcus alpinitundrae TaxID=468913 RepID=UPI001ED94C7A|nr:NUDIX domain-containing protein [Deinococcus alpinitundrae]
MQELPETFAVPCVGAMIHREIGGQPQILIQERQKKSGGVENGLLELAAGKVREYENIFDAPKREVREETGLSLLSIQGESERTVRTINGYEVMSFTPFARPKISRAATPSSCRRFSARLRESCSGVHPRRRTFVGSLSRRAEHSLSAAQRTSIHFISMP